MNPEKTSAYTIKTVACLIAKGDFFTLSEVAYVDLYEARNTIKEYQDIRRQFWALVKNRPFLFFKYLFQRWAILFEIAEEFCESHSLT